MITVFDRFDPLGCAFPRPIVPLLPRLSSRSFSLRRTKTYGFSGGRHQRLFFTKGRYALREAYRLSGVKPGTSILIASYHCRTMIDPAVALGADVTLYPVTTDLTPVWESMDELVNRSSIPIKALLLTHFFGFWQDVVAARSFCLRHGLYLIEDCSHAYVHAMNGPAPGDLSDFAVTSPYKFVPCDDGGELFGNRPLSTAGPLIQARINSEIRAIVRIFRNARPRGSSSRKKTEQNSDPTASNGTDTTLPGNCLSSLYDRNQENTAGHRNSRLLIRLCDPEKIANVRRRNYLQLTDLFSNVPQCRPLLPELPNEVVPYMFPLYLETPEKHFAPIKRAYIPTWRWDEMARSFCTVAADYRLKLIHLPCHQDLSVEEITWLADTIKSIVSSGPLVANRRIKVDIQPL